MFEPINLKKPKQSQILQLYITYNCTVLKNLQGFLEHCPLKQTDKTTEFSELPLFLGILKE